MRYFELIITPTTSNGTSISVPFRCASNNLLTGHSTLPSQIGSYNPDYPDIEFEYTQSNDNIKPSLTITVSASTTLPQLGQEFNFQNAKINLWAGMANGLTTSDNGKPLFSGKVDSAVGNWAQNNISITLNCSPTAIFNSNIQGSFFFKCMIGDTLSQTIKNSLTPPFKEAKTPIPINTDALSAPELLSCPQAERFRFKDMDEFIAQITIMTQGWSVTDPIWKGKYVSAIYTQDGRVKFLLNGENAPSLPNPEPKKILFSEMIGQPTYNQLPNGDGSIKTQITLSTAMRADINCGDHVCIINNLAGTLLKNAHYSIGNGPTLRTSKVFSGIWVVQQVHYVGKSRSTDGTQWATNFTLIPYIPLSN